MLRSGVCFSLSANPIRGQKNCIFFRQLQQNSSRFDFLERYFQLTLCHITASDLLPFAARIACGLNQNKAQCPQKLVTQFQRVLDCVFPIVLNNNGTLLCKVLRCITVSCRSVSFQRDFFFLHYYYYYYS